MELRVIILSVACLSLLVPPAYTTPILTAKIGAAKGAALLGAGALVKGAIVAKGAAALAAKGAILKGAGLLAVKALKAKGAALLAAKGAAIKGALAAKGALIGGAASIGKKVVNAKIEAVHSLLDKPHVHETVRYVPHEPAYIIEDFEPIPPMPPQFPAILAGRLSGLWDIAANSVAAKASAASQLFTALHGSEVRVVHEPAVVYEIEDTPQFVYPVPVIEKDC